MVSKISTPTLGPVVKLASKKELSGLAVFVILQLYAEFRPLVELFSVNDTTASSSHQLLIVEALNEDRFVIGMVNLWCSEFIL